MTEWLNIAVPVPAALGFLALAMASERPGPALLGRKPDPGQRLRLRIAGWFLLALAFAMTWQIWGGGVGPVTWFGGLTMTGAGLAFAVPVWERARAVPDPKARPKRPIPPVPLLPPLQSALSRGLAVALLCASPVVFLAFALSAPGQPVMRADALYDQAGPYSFVIAHYDRKTGDLDTPTAWQIRFCDGCEDQLQTARLGIDGAHVEISLDDDTRNHRVDLPLPASTDSRLWLEALDRDGRSYRTSWPLAKWVTDPPAAKQTAAMVQPTAN